MGQDNCDQPYTSSSSPQTGHHVVLSALLRYCGSHASYIHALSHLSCFCTNSSSFFTSLLCTHLSSPFSCHLLLSPFSLLFSPPPIVTVGQCELRRPRKGERHEVIKSSLCCNCSERAASLVPEVTIPRSTHSHYGHEGAVVIISQPTI